MKSSIIILLTLYLFLSCSKKKEIAIVTSENSGTFFNKKLSNRKLMDSLEKRVLFNGDTIAYNELKGIYYIGEQKPTELLYFSIIMSNKYNYKKASYDVYDILTHDNEALDTITNKIATNYLEKRK